MSFLLSCKRQLTLLLLIGWSFLGTAQTNDTTLSFFEPAPEFHPTRTYSLAISGGLFYTGTLWGLNHYWYSQFPQTRFHLFNDNHLWLQMDKAGHFHTGYFLSSWSHRLALWAGNRPGPSRWYGGLAGNTFLTIVEVLDGFSADWGASWGDFGANLLGAGAMIAQDAAWGEQRMTVKYSFTPVQYPKSVQVRAKNLFGSELSQQMLKDYNGQTYWLSGSPRTFTESVTPWPRWLNVAVGYGAQGMLGGSENIWKKDGTIIDRTDIARYRQFYLSADIDFTNIPTDSELLSSIFHVLNIFKVPAPVLEVNTRSNVRFYWLYF